MSWRTALAVAAGKAAGGASRRLGRGGGTAIAGLVAERVDPALVAALAAQLGHGSALVTGTNGKTTTAHMVTAAARKAGLRPLHNPSGSNLMRGVATALVEEASGGRIREGAERLGIFEVDEATLPHAARTLRPRAIAFTNLFRDQLDRYGEVDTVAELWRRALGALPSSTAIALNADDPAVASLASTSPGRVLLFGVDDVSLAQEGPEHASDFRWCLACGGELAYAAAFYGHVGHWSCPSCGGARPAPEVRAVRAEPRPAGATGLTLDTPAGEMSLELPLAGLYNVYNALAAAACALALELPLEAVREALSGFRAAFGRQEAFEMEGRRVQIFLGKNPTGLNEVLRAIAAQEGRKHLLLFLNDGIADGRDVSWIWDADYEILAGRTASVFAAGTRAEDLALRLKYAGFGSEVPIVSRTDQALSVALAATAEGETLYVVPTYTAMLEVRELLARRGHRPHYWEEGS
jgi:UDP-N-acetylmuramyl tripeptide synthase